MKRPALAAVMFAALCGHACTCAEPRTTLPTYDAPRAQRAPTIDGRLDDAIWERAERTPLFVNTMDGSAAGPESWAKIAWDDEAVYVAFDVSDTFIRATLTGHDAHLWEQDCVEIMVDPDGDGLAYYEMQLSPTNEVFDTRYDSRRVPQPFGHVDWDSGLRGAAIVRGAANDDDDDEGYVAELAIPWSAFTEAPTRGAAPSQGDTWRFALYVLDARRQGWGGVAWSPPMVGDFHVPERFGHVTFTAD